MSRIREFFDQIAESYAEQRYGGGADPWRAHFFRGRLRQAGALLEGVSGRVLDLGSGPGVLESVLGPGTRLVHLDVSLAMLRRAGGVKLGADALAVPLRAESIDCIVALGLTSYLDDLGPLFSEARRLLRPGGRLLVSITRRAAPDTLLRGLFRRSLGRLCKGKGVLASGLPIRAWSERETRRSLAASGFRTRAIRRHNFTVFPFCYLLGGPSLRLGRRLERKAGPFDGLASDVLFLAEKGPRPPPRQGAKIRVLRVIARLNVGGPARQAVLLTKSLDSERYESALVTGRVAPHEGDMLPDARAAGLDPVVLEGLGRRVRILGDLAAFAGLLREILAFRPHVVHTHTAKAGALGRVAALLAGVPVRIHTFHGHVLHGYFGRMGSALVRATEKVLARITTRIVAVSPEVAEDLTVRHRIADKNRIAVVPLGLLLDDLRAAERHRGELRTELRIPAGAPVITTVGRITSVKEPDVLLETARLVLRHEPEARFVVAGGGELLQEMKEGAARLSIGDRMHFLGWRSDLARIQADADLALLTSRNEGTPVALIEAAAAGVPAVATRVGGVPSVVADGVTGLLAPAGDAAALAKAVVELLGDGDRRRKMGAAARERVLARFSARRLLGDIDRLYRLCSADRRRVCATASSQDRER